MCITRTPHCYIVTMTRHTARRQTGAIINATPMYPIRKIINGTYFRRPTAPEVNNGEPMIATCGSRITSAHENVYACSPIPLMHYRDWESSAGENTTWHTRPDPGVSTCPLVKPTPHIPVLSTHTPRNISWRHASEGWRTVRQYVCRVLYSYVRSAKALFLPHFFCRYIYAYRGWLNRVRALENDLYIESAKLLSKVLPGKKRGCANSRRIDFCLIGLYSVYVCTYVLLTLVPRIAIVWLSL